MSTPALYKVVLRNTAFVVQAVFDSVLDLTYTKEVNETGSYSFSLEANDARATLFDLDYVVEIFRAVPSIGVAYYQEFVGLHRRITLVEAADGSMKYNLSGIGLLDLLGRTIINYHAGTIMSYKNIAAETAIKEYVEENCGPSATVLNERLSEGTLPSFSVEADGAAGDVWEGDRSCENLLDVIKDIAKFADMDFDVQYDESVGDLVFKTFADQLGTDRTVIGLNPATGLNAAGNSPVVFATIRGNVQSLTRDLDRTSESNVCTVLGEGDGATRDVKVRSTAAVFDSIWNRREFARSKSGFENEMEVAGDEALNEEAASEVVEFEPLFQESCAYGLHFFVGDRVTVYSRGSESNKRLTSVTATIGEKEALTFKFSDIKI